MEALLEEGCVIVATSNRAPWDLNRHGLHEDLFSHFVQNLLEACDVVELSSQEDYRRLLAGPEVLCSLLAEHPHNACSVQTGYHASKPHMHHFLMHSCRHACCMLIAVVPMSGFN
jgi:predicted ATPase